jgi:hypothetical protein
VHTIIIACISLISSYVSRQYEFTLYVDFFIIGVILAFPISFAMREAFRRRERAIAYLSQFKATLQSLFFSFENSKLGQEKKTEVKFILSDISKRTIEYLAGKPDYESNVEEYTQRFFLFIRQNEENLKGSFSVKVMLFFFRVNESIEFLLATKRHKTPLGVRMVVLFSIYLFAVLYPSSLLHRVGFQGTLFYIFITTYFKAFLFTCLYNIQNSLEDPFIPGSVDSIRLHDFAFSPLNDALPSSIPGDLKTEEKISAVAVVSPDAPNKMQ